MASPLAQPDSSDDEIEEIEFIQVWYTGDEDPEDPYETETISSDDYTMPYTNPPWAAPTERPSVPPWVRPHGPPPWVTTTTSSSSQITPQPEYGHSKSLTPISEGNALSTASESASTSTGAPVVEGEKKVHHKGMVMAMGVAVPLLVLAGIAILAFIVLRKRRRNKRQAIAHAQAQVDQMKYSGRPSHIAAHYHVPPPPPSTSPQFPQPSAQPPYSGPPGQPPPVILGPIVPGSNGAYFTGIDTSDVVSVNNDHPPYPPPGLNDRTGLGNPFADNNSINDEPPPPYRPRSIAALSRDSSLRSQSRNPPPPPFPPQLPPIADHSRTNLLDAFPSQTGSSRSPFADPDSDSDDDAISQISGRAPRRARETMSDVSDMSYQQDPRPGV
ncbi:hypothetical protein BU24DRAFT_415348 [Aaosphaeria arxii CBS 175.79]|uniref:Uncharacterized protein n=1 Tax=Aaosphaeria arxii CBS 175.79 TaxID=1450172 RepID=A0A6A5X7W6_9PLEO|nr:uncharacterized protein BU24DRAFT_415348 [Aaosphaeria arxii CBS 175.79]KAF2008989.1 hypothetical protein BU24DRAFT_415348 [Aaosphaeria arxii CBS 175.79]